MSRGIGMRAVQNRSAVSEPTRSLVQVETTNLEEVIDAQVDSTILKPDDKDVCIISRASGQRLEQSVQ